MKCAVPNTPCKHHVLYVYCGAESKDQCVTLQRFLEYAERRQMDPDPEIRQACNDLVNELR